MNIYMYTVYTYLSVDIYECMSNVSITCRYRQYVLSLYMSCYISIWHQGLAPAFFLLSTVDYMYIHIQI